MTTPNLPVGRQCHSDSVTGFGRPHHATNTSANLDALRAVAVLLVVGFHIARILNWESGSVRVTDFGLLGVMLFFVHTTLVLMFSLERQRARTAGPLFLRFMVRRIFRIYPLSVLVVLGVYVFNIPSELGVGRMNLLHQTPFNLISNVLLIQNITLQTANPGPLWSLPLELQMYVVLPALFILSSRVKSTGPIIGLWCSAVAVWLTTGFASGLYPLTGGTFRSPVEIVLKGTQFVPCFLPGVIAYKLWHRSRPFPGYAWPVYLLSCCGIFMLTSGKEPIQAGWFICVAVGVGLCFFGEMQTAVVCKPAHLIAKYSYGIYLLHYFALWTGFVVCRQAPMALRCVVFAATLVTLSVTLYHAVEAPMIALGVRVSERKPSLSMLIQAPYARFRGITSKPLLSSRAVAAEDDPT